MAVLYNSQNVDTRFSSILEPNLFYGSVFIPGVTCTDKYLIGPAGGIFVHKLATSACAVGTPGRDFTDEETQDALIPITLNNNYQKSKKIYGVQAAAVGIQLANENMALAIQEVREGWQQSALACLVQESTAATAVTAITVDNLKEDVIATRTQCVTAKGSANIMMCAPEYYGKVLLAAGAEFTPILNDKIAATGRVGNWLGFTYIEAPGASAASAKYYDNTGTLKTVSFAGLDYIMYNSETLSAVSNFETARLVDSENFVGSKAQVEMNTGFRVTNAALAYARKHTVG